MNPRIQRIWRIRRMACASRNRERPHDAISFHLAALDHHARLVSALMIS
jgi:hypothetical protein